MKNFQRPESHHHEPMKPGVAMLLGLGIGIIGTTVVIAANEERFGNAARRTRKRAREVGEEVEHRYRDAVSHTKDHAADLAEKAAVTAHKLSERLADKDK